MLSQEKYVKKNSEYFVYTPSVLAKELFFYPLVLGHFYYEKDYFLHRSSYDSFLVMYVREGSCTVGANDQIVTAKKGDVVCLDCYQPHAYYTNEGWEALWLHFGGALGAQYMEYLIRKRGYVIPLNDCTQFEYTFFGLLQPFQKGIASREAVMSLKITEILTEMILSAESVQEAGKCFGIVEQSISYIQEHINSQITLQELADNVNLSKFYYGRQFKNETGFTPYEYTIIARINHAKYLLNSTSASVKEICFMCGFTSESAFCKTFKKWERKTPMEFRSEK